MFQSRQMAVKKQEVSGVDIPEIVVFLALARRRDHEKRGTVSHRLVFLVDAFQDIEIVAMSHDIDVIAAFEGVDEAGVHFFFIRRERIDKKQHPLEIFMQEDIADEIRLVWRRFDNASILELLIGLDRRVARDGKMGDYLVHRREPVAKVQFSRMDQFLNAFCNLEKFGLIA